MFYKFATKLQSNNNGLRYFSLENFFFLFYHYNKHNLFALTKVELKAFVCDVVAFNLQCMKYFIAY